MPTPRHDPMTAFLVGMSGIALFSAMDAVMKGLVIAVGAFATMFWRNLTGIGIAGALYFRSGMRLPSRDAMRLHVSRGLLGTMMGFLFFWALGRVPLAQAIALSFISPLIAIYLAAVFLGERVGQRTVAGSITAFAGVLVIF